MTVQKVRDFLDSHEVRFITITHSRAFTAQDTAERAEIPGKEMAKTVMIKVDDKMAMAVLPAPFQIDFEVLTMSLNAHSVALAEETDFLDLFPGCELGAMPPFGNLYDMDVFVDEILTEDEFIAFHAGSLNEVMQLSYADFTRLVEPVILSFSMEFKMGRKAA